MPDRPNPKKNRNQQSPEDIQVSPISKQTVGAVTGAAIGSVVGAYIGARMLKRIPERALNIGVAVLLALVGVKEFVFP